MGAPSLREAFIVGLDILATALDDATNIATAVLGNSSVPSAPASSTGAEFWFPPGYFALPAEPASGSPSAQAFAVRQGDRDVILAVRDGRSAARYGNARPGEFVVYATAGQARVIGKKDGSVTLYTTDTNDEKGKAVFFRIGPEIGFQFVAPWGTFVFDKTGLTVRHASGFEMRGGPIGGLPGPLSAFASKFEVVASVAKVAGSLVLLGSGPFYNPCVWAPAENPLTTPGVPLTAIGFGAPTGQFTSASVRISGAPGTG